MSYDEATEAIRVLEDQFACFDYDKSVQYAMLVKEFVRRTRYYCEANRLALHLPFVEIVPHFPDLPNELQDALLFIARRRNWSPRCVSACREYLKYLLSKDELPKSQREIANVYEPLFKLLADGGDFYEHHGDICIRDTATIVLSKC